MECRHVPGFTLSVVKGGDVWARGFGRADISAGVPVDNSTLFAIGSVTKSFTMVLLGILLTEKKLDWTAKVMEILGPEYGFVDEYRTRESTLKDLLSHRTGLDGHEFGVISGYPETVSREELSKNLKFLPEKKAFRDGFIYNNYMYMLLGHVAEKLGGETWENLITSRVLTPIGMSSSKLLKQPSDVFIYGVAQPYILRDGQFANGTRSIYTIRPMEPSGAILSNGVDMAKYIRFIINMGKTDKGEQLLDTELLKQAFIGIISDTSDNYRTNFFLTQPTFPAFEIPLGYGHAFTEAFYNGNRRVDHSGGVFSYITLLWIFPDQHIGIFASTNGPAVNALQMKALTTTFYHVSDILLGYKPWINVTNACTFPGPWRNDTVTEFGAGEISRELRNAKEYTGFYGNNVLSGIHVESDDKSNTSLKFTMGLLNGYLQSTTDHDRFMMEIMSPAEFYAPFMDKNNVTMKFHVTFLRYNNECTLLQLHFNMPLNFTKQGYITSTRGQAVNNGQGLTTSINCVISVLAYSFANNP
ncbi:hypothetical protein DPMN_117230 [Dreissena polymorpha]|uniref:Beta-lactamase-related domain-containing protein n=3 Tax=Dreissena polymorpha TaxID=45954 RepID=A0A9D4KRB2_DREPO|nr:hypothetical protein DPMN_117230 [Dreissena polymorpha]